MCTRGQATHCVRRVLSVLAEVWADEGGGENARLVPKECALNSGESGGTMRLAAMGSSLLVILREGRGVVLCVYGIREG